MHYRAVTEFIAPGVSGAKDRRPRAARPGRRSGRAQPSRYPVAHRLPTRPRRAIVSGHMISRRGLLTGSVALLATPLAAEGQQAGEVYRTRLLASYPGAAVFKNPFVAAPPGPGHLEGQNIAVA